VPILDQGARGACTGYGLATVANYLQLRRRVIPTRSPVSPRMLYTMARRYDEWPGEDYEGSSARGAMKGWHKHGVCREDLYRLRQGRRQGLTEMRTSRGAQAAAGRLLPRQPQGPGRHALGHRRSGRAVCDEHGARRLAAGGGDGVIRFSERIIGGHAFAIVAYDDEASGCRTPGARPGARAASRA
jgi:hypothetical protein